jgi:hypothetical protein
MAKHVRVRLLTTGNVLWPRSAAANYPPEGRLEVMVTFNVVRQEHGWAVQMGSSMTMPFRLRDMATREANSLADGIRRHGEIADVVVEAAGPSDLHGDDGTGRRVVSAYPELDARA